MQNERKYRFYGTNNIPSMGVYATTSDAHTLTDGPTIYLVEDIEKIGTFSPGKHIPIVSIDEFHKRNPDVAYLFAWNHKDEIFAKEKKFIKNGGKWFSHVAL